MSLDSGMAVAGLIAVLGEVRGRKRLQKMIHLLQAKSTSAFQYRFTLHYFGPFSRELASDLDFLGSIGLLHEQSPAQGETSYVYSMPSQGIADRILGFCGEGQPEPDWAPLARSLNDKNTLLLEALSTVVFLSKRGHDSDALRAKFAAAKPHLEMRFEEAFRFGAELGLLPA